MSGLFLADFPDDRRRAGDFLGADRLAPAAQVLGQERLGAGVEVDPVLGPGEAVALVGVEDIAHPAAVLLDRGDDLLGLGLLDPGVVRPLADQQRALDLVGLEQRRGVP